MTNKEKSGGIPQQVTGIFPKFIISIKALKERQKKDDGQEVNQLRTYVRKYVANNTDFV